ARLDDPLGDEEAEAEAAEIARAHRALERLEDSLELVGGDADAVIGDADRGVPVAGGDLDLDRLAPAVIHPVAYRGRDHLVHPDAIPDAGHARGGAEIDVGFLGEPFGDLADELVEKEGLRLELEVSGRHP